MRQTMVDIARAARVSTATVDRVLHERAGVRGLDACPGARGRARDRLSARLRARRPRSQPAALRLRPAERPQHLHGSARGPSGAGAACARPPSCACRCIVSTGSAPRRWRHSLRALKGSSDGLGDHRHRPSPRPRGDPRGGKRRHPGPDPGLRHRACAAPWLCRHRQPQRRPPRGPPARPLRPGLGGRGRPVRGLAQLSRPRGARDGLSPHPRRGLPESADRRAARGPRRSGAQLRRGRARCWPHDPSCAGSTISAPATGASPGRSRRAAGPARWCSSATS